MKKILFLCSLFLFASQLSFSQDSTYYKEVLKTIQTYERCLQLTGDTNANASDRKSSSADLIKTLATPKIYVFDDLDSTEADTNFIKFGAYMKELSELKYGFETKINYKKLKIDTISINYARNTYGTKAYVMKYMNIPYVNETVIDTFRLDTTTVTVPDTSSENKIDIDTVRFKYVQRDTVYRKVYSKLTFHFKCKKDLTYNKVSDFKLFGISKFRGAEKFLKLSKNAQWWVSLPPLWKEAVNKQLNLGEVPSKYRLGFIKGLDRLDFKGSKIKTLEPVKGLTGIKYLDIRETEIVDLSPIKDATSLEQLYISDTKVDTLWALEKLVNLKILKANRVKVRDISYLSNMTQMEELELVECELDTLAALSKMTKLEKLHINDNEDVTSFEPLRGIASLEELHARKCRVTSLSPIRNNLNLVKLDVFNNQDIPDLRPISHMKKITYLDVGYTGFKSTSEIKDLYYLTYLNVTGDALDDFSAISKFSYLRELYVDNTHMNSVAPIMNLEYIRVFKARNTKIPKQDIQKFKKKHPKCQITYY